MPNFHISDEALASAVASSTKMAEMLTTLGLRYAGGTHALYRKRINRLGLDTSHWLNPYRTRFTGTNKKSPEEILIHRPDGIYRASRAQLKRAMIEVGVPYVCGECGQPPEWNGKPLVLQIDHKNGDSLDDRQENVHFLCPNCHTQTVTYGRSYSI